MALKLKLNFTIVMAGLVLLACGNAITRFYNNSPLKLKYNSRTLESGVSGVVLDQGGNPVANAQIQLHSAYQAIKTQTALDGSFNLLLTIPGDSLSLTIKAANYSTLVCKSLSRYMLINDDWQFRLTDESSKPPVTDSTRCTIRGMVKDSTGEPIPGASIRLSGTQIGAASGIDGHFLMKDIHPGNYEFSCYSIGFSTKRINILNIAAGSIDTLLITLEMQSISIGDYNLIDGPLPIDKYIANNQWEVKSEKLSRRPAKNINQTLKACPGISR